MLSILCTNRLHAEWILKENSVPNLVALLSCHDRASEPCKGFDEFSGHKHSTSFEDSEPGGWLGEGSATLEEVQEILAWGGPLKDLEGTMLVHCNAGVGRSTAVSMLLQCLWDGETVAEFASMKTAFARSVTQPCPNEHIAMLGDQVLNRNGRILEEIKSFNDALKGSRLY